VTSAPARGDIRVTIQRGDVHLAGYFLVPANAVRPPAVIFVHGLGSGKDSPRNAVIAERLREAGIASLLFDLSGHGESSADVRGNDMAAYCDDLASAFAWLRSREEVDGNRIGIAGSSLGGVTALHALDQGRVGPLSLLLRAPPVALGDLEHVGVPTLVLAGTLDPLSDMLDALPRSDRVRIAKIEGASHLFEEPGTLERALEETVNWFRETLGAAIGGN
jgi:pimeloyl-ACP methyl ester carboxylesterase